MIKNNLKYLYTSLALLVLSASLFLPFSATPASAIGQPEKVVLQLAWKHQFQFAGYYAAFDLGFYREAGLDVRIVEGGEGRFAREELLAGRADYGIAGAELVLHHAEGDPFVVLAAVFQHSPSILLTRADSGISHPQHLIGKRVMLLEGKKDADILAVFQNENVTPDAFYRLPQSYNLNDLLTGRTDAVSAYLTNEPWQLEQKGIRPGIIKPVIYGVDFYSDCLFTTKGEIKDHRDRVNRFLNASLRGWDYAMAHPEAIIDIMLASYDVKKTRDHLLFEAEAIRSIMLPDLVEIGHMNPGRWRHIAETYAGLGMLPPDYSPESASNSLLYDPNPQIDYTWVLWTIGGLLLVSLVCSTGVALLAGFNRKLRQEINERKTAEEALRYSEEKFAKAFHHGPTMVTISEISTGKYIAVNETFVRVTGYPESDAVGRTSVELGFITSNDRDRLKQILDGNKSVNGLELTLRKKNGDPMYAEYYGEIIAVTGTPMLLSSAIDITARKTAEKKNTELALQLRHVHKMEALGTLVGGIAHNFNNMLGIIIGNAEVATDDLPEQSPVGENLKEITNAGLRARDVVRQLLHFTNHTIPQRRAVHIPLVIKNAIKLIRSSIPAGIDFQMNLSSRDTTVMADPDQISQIIINLCNNAVQAMPEGGILGISVHPTVFKEKTGVGFHELTPGRYVQLSVTDTGHGIASENLDRIFDPYFTTREVGKGSGIGLSVVHGIVTGHEGALSVTSSVGSGTTVDVYFPGVEAEPADDHRSAEQPVPGGDERILFIDDEAAITRLAFKNLRKLGYDVTVETNPQYALDLFRENPYKFDLVITDMTMPVMTGDLLFQEIQAILPDTPVIICTGFSEKINRTSATALGAAGYIEKPAEIRVLAQAIRNALDHRAL